MQADGHPRHLDSAADGGANEQGGGVGVVEVAAQLEAVLQRARDREQHALGRQTLALLPVAPGPHKTLPDNFVVKSVRKKKRL